MADKKVVFVVFAIEDERQRDFLKGQSLNAYTGKYDHQIRQLLTTDSVN
jgi:hypothetical protein